MLNLKTYIALALIATVFFGCKRQDIGEYENDPRLYFFIGKAYEESHTTDSLTYSFFFAPDDYTRDTVYVDLRAMGLKSDQPRPFTISQENTTIHKAAIPGKHFLPFDTDDMNELWWMPAGKVQYLMPVILLRDQSLSDEKVELKLRIEENGYFKTGIGKQLTFRIIFTSMAEQPLTWNYWITAYGAWGERKMWFIMNYLGITDFDKYSTDYPYNSYLKAVAQKQLARYNANNPILKEADGTPVTF